jgi:bifunctional UDP-N-acetylglucosamine pyrophosphorylase/glucosamine-1-phosphate N-acetyltransferase
MKSSVPKVLHRLAGRTLIDYVLRAAETLNPSSITLVVGHQGDLLKKALAGYRHLRFVTQEPQLGTAHAVLQTAPVLQDAQGTLLLLSGDVPLLSSATLGQVLSAHSEAGAAATVLTAMVERPYGYGRIVRSQGAIARIVEERDASPTERAIREINSGVYAFDLEPLFPALESVAAQNAQGEYYLPDLVAIFRRRGRPVATVSVENPDEIRGINSRTELAEVGALVRQQKNEELMAAGVTLVDPATTYVDADVVIGPDTVIHPNVYLEGQTKIGAACEVFAGVRIADSTIGDRVTINNFCVLDGATVASDARVGPFAHLRPGSDVRERARVGNFVELKNTVLGEASKANHHAYLGDATIGANVNVGAGTITCNYDGRVKHQTVVEDGAFIGSDTQLVAPVRVGRGAYVAAGSSIVEDVPAGALGIARGRQSNVEGWAQKRAQKQEAEAPSGSGHGG